MSVLKIHSGPVAKSDYPEFNSEERERIGALLNRRDHLASRESFGWLVQREIEALTWVLDFLKGTNDKFEAGYRSVLERRREFLRDNRNQENGWENQEYSALTWLLTKEL